MRARELVVLLWLCAGAAHGEPPAGALVPLDPTPIRVEELEVHYDLTVPPQPGGRVLVQACLHNPERSDREARFMLALGAEEGATFRLGGERVAPLMVAGKLPGWGTSTPVATFPVRLRAGARTELVCTFAVRARRSPTSFSFRYLLQAPGGEPAFRSARLEVRAPPGLEVRSEPPLVEGSVTLGPASRAADWRLRVFPPAAGAAVPLITLSTMASLLGAGLGLALAGRCGRGPALAALAGGTACLCLVLVGTRLLALWGIPAWCLEGERWSVIHALLGYGAAPLLAALSASAARVLELRWG